MIETKVHDLCVTLVGIALSRSVFSLCNQVVDALGTTSWGCVLHDYKRNVIDCQTKKDDKEEV